MEKVEYTISPDNPGKTLAVRSAWIDSQVFGFARAIRAFGCDRFRKNCNKMVRHHSIQVIKEISHSIHQRKLIQTISNFFQVSGFNFVLSSMFPTHVVNSAAAAHGDHTYMAKATKLKEVAKKKSEQVKAQAENIYQSYSVKS